MLLIRLHSVVVFSLDMHHKLLGRAVQTLGDPCQVRYRYCSLQFYKQLHSHKPLYFSSCSCRCGAALQSGFSPAANCTCCICSLCNLSSRSPLELQNQHRAKLRFTKEPLNSLSFSAFSWSRFSMGTCSFDNRFTDASTIVFQNLRYSQS
jgi:hypothetical protein